MDRALDLIHAADGLVTVTVAVRLYFLCRGSLGSHHVRRSVGGNPDTREVYLSELSREEFD